MLGEEQRELATAYRLFEQNMKMTLQAWEKSERLMKKYTEQQMLNYKVRQHFPSSRTFHAFLPSLESFNEKTTNAEAGS